MRVSAHIQLTVLIYIIIASLANVHWVWASGGPVVRMPTKEHNRSSLVPSPRSPRGLGTRLLLGGDYGYWWTSILRVVLWSAPRCMSSVFERSVRELQDVKVIYEPHQQAYYYGPERKTDANHPTLSELNPAATFQAADEKFLQPYEGYRAVFLKIMPFLWRETTSITLREDSPTWSIHFWYGTPTSPYLPWLKHAKCVVSQLLVMIME